MNRLLKILPLALATGMIAIGETSGFDPDALRPYTAVAALVCLGAYFWRRGLFSPIEQGFVGYLVFAALGFWLWPEGLGALIAAVPVTMIYVSLFMVAVVPPLVGMEPFTAFFAKQGEPPAVWETRAFQTICMRLNWFWAGLFALSSLSALAPWALGHREDLVWVLACQAAIPLALMAIVGRKVTQTYPKRYLEAHGGAGPALARDCREMISMMPIGFDPAAAGDLQAVIQFEISGEEEFTAHLAIAGGRCRHHQGPAPGKPDLIIQSPASVWMAISKGEQDGAQALGQGQYKAQGDITLLMRMNQLFQR